MAEDSQEPVEDVTQKAEGDGGVVHLKEEAKVRMEAEVRPCQVQLRYLHPGETGTRVAY